MAVKAIVLIAVGGGVLLGVAITWLSLRISGGWYEMAIDFVVAAIGALAVFIILALVF